MPELSRANAELPPIPAKRYFTIGEVSADKAYLSLENFEQVAGFGGTAFLPFKSNSTGGAGGP